MSGIAVGTFTDGDTWNNESDNNIIPDPINDKSVTLKTANKYVTKDIVLTIEPMSAGRKAQFDGGATLTSETPELTISSGGTFKNQSARGVTTTKPSGTDGTDYFSISCSGTYNINTYQDSYTITCTSGGFIAKDYAFSYTNTFDPICTNNFSTLYVPKASVTVANPTVSGESVTSTGASATLSTTANDTGIGFTSKYVGTVAKASASWTSGLIGAGSGTSASTKALSKENTFYINAITVSKGTFNKVSLTGGTLVFNDGITDWHWTRSGNTVTVT